MMTEDLAFRFDVSPGKVSQTVVTWVHLLSAELRPLIAWPSRGKLRRELPDCFKRLYPKVRTIIDCSEIFFDTPSALDVQACLWSDYKHHCTAKFLVAITPNGSISWLSPLYGGRASDIHIVRNSGFLDIFYETMYIMHTTKCSIWFTNATKRCQRNIKHSKHKNLCRASNQTNKRF